ncbi:MAG: STAS-like domain-containing protein [Endomicrobium sp.]|nr:STAS-like domain-containing protein [Endomicrobium sp.]
MNEILEEVTNWAMCKDVIEPRRDYYKTRNLFQSELNKFLSDTNDSLLTAVVGEIWNNSYDHNLGSWKDVVRITFLYDLTNKIVTLVDRGQGIKETPSKVKNDIQSDEQAINIALTEVISGRLPEQRGNGLKFVSKVVKMKKWRFYLQSGYDCVEMKAKISKSGNLLVSRPEGKEAFLTAKAYTLKHDETEFVLDFSDVDVLTPPWADEFISAIKKEFKNTTIKYENITNPSVKETLNMLNMIIGAL